MLAHIFCDFKLEETTTQVRQAMSKASSLQQFLKSNEYLFQHESKDIVEEDLGMTEQDDEKEPEDCALPSEVTEQEIEETLEVLKVQNLLGANVPSDLLAKQPQIQEAFKCFKTTNDATDFVETISFFVQGL